MATKEQALAAVYSEGKSLWVKDPAVSGASGWLELPGLLDFSSNAGERGGRTAGTDSTRPRGVTTNMQAPTVEATFKYVSSPNWDVPDSAFSAGTVLNWRMETQGEVVQDFSDLATGPSVAIALDGTCTFTNNPTGGLHIDDFPLGGVIRVGSNDYPIKDVTNSGDTVTAVTAKVSAAVSAATFVTAVSAERISFRGKVLICPPRQHGIAQQSEREGTLSIQCTRPMSRPVRIV